MEIGKSTKSILNDNIWAAVESCNTDFFDIKYGVSLHSNLVKNSLRRSLIRPIDNIVIYRSLVNWFTFRFIHRDI